jgi:hypothetical protein
MATLIAGFSFTALVSTESIKLDLNSVQLLYATGGELQEVINASTGATLTTPIYEFAGPVYFFSLLMHVGEMAAVIASLGQMLTVITESLIARLLGARLALRGPDGSIIRSTRHLATALASSTRGFFNGLQFFILACFFHVLRGQHPLIAIFLVAILYPYWRHQGTLADELSRKFHLVQGVTTAFTVVPRKPKSPRSPRFKSPRAKSPRTPRQAPPPDHDASGTPWMAPKEAAEFDRVNSRRGSSDLSFVFRRAMEQSSAGRSSRNSSSRDSHSDEAVKAWRERRRLSTAGLPKKSAAQKERDSDKDKAGTQKDLADRSENETQEDLAEQGNDGMPKDLDEKSRRPSVGLPRPQRFPPPQPAAAGGGARGAGSGVRLRFGSRVLPAKGQAGRHPTVGFGVASSRDLRRRVGSLTHASLEKMRSAKLGTMRRVVDETESPLQSARDTHEDGPRYKRLLGKAYYWINPVSHRLHYLFEQVSEDFEGEGAAANKVHKTPTAATSMLISTTESQQLDRIHRDFDEINKRNAEALEMPDGIKGALKILDLWA